MADIINKVTLRIINSAHSPDYEPEWEKSLGDNWSGHDYIVNPKLPKCEQKYWKIVGGKVAEMTILQKAAADSAIQDKADEQTKEILIADKKETISTQEAIDALIAEGVLNEDGTLKK